MKSTLLVRPNLKLFLIGALLIAVLQDLISNGQSDTSILTAWAARKSGSEAELQQLLQRAEVEPNSESYARISTSGQTLAAPQRLRLYLRRAEALSLIEE